jgi:hypothetical protein
MNELTILEHRNARVLTTEQLAEQYGANSKMLSKNFSNNRERYIEGKHFHRLEGDILQQFLQTSNLRLQNASKIRVFYLWTERGALLHAKSLNTDKAWEVYDRLVETYFRVRALKSVPADKPDRLQIMELNARTRRAKLLYQMAHDTLSAEYRDTLVAKASELALGESVAPVQPPPVQPVRTERRTLTAAHLWERYLATMPSR